VGPAQRDGRDGAGRSLVRLGGGGPTDKLSRAPARATPISRENDRQKSNDLERTGRGVGCSGCWAATRGWKRFCIAREPYSLEVKHEAKTILYLLKRSRRHLPDTLIKRELIESDDL
jgi:hypothetical protein